MRAATQVGLTFVGARSASAAKQKDEGFKPRVIAPDKGREALRVAYVEAIADRIAFWQAELEQWTAEFGAEAVKNLEMT